jgi:hypothetical protein
MPLKPLIRLEIGKSAQTEPSIPHPRDIIWSHCNKYTSGNPRAIASCFSGTVTGRIRHCGLHGASTIEVFYLSARV